MAAGLWASWAGAQTPVHPARTLALPGLRRAVQASAHLDTETASIHGGLRPGSASDTVAQAGVTLDSAPLGLWKGGRLHGSVVHIESSRPSRDYVGDLQVASNLEAPAADRVYQLWYRQRLSRCWQARAGLIDLNQSLAVTPQAGLFLNASFGITPSIAANVPTSLYPKPGLGLVARRRGPAGAGLRLGLFQGQPGHRQTPFGHGVMAIAEQAQGRWKLGGWVYRGHGRDRPRHDWGAYAIVHDAWRDGGPGRIEGFLQLGASPARVNVVPYYLGAGLVWRGPLAGRPRDRFGLGVARAWVRDRPAPAETAWEVTYAVRVGHHVYLQPDLQYVAHPAGRTPASDATVAFLRLHLEFD